MCNRSVRIILAAVLASPSAHLGRGDSDDLTSSGGHDGGFEIDPYETRTLE